MGSWGTGLYSSDFALDLRQLIGAVARLPFEPDRLLEILCETEPAAAGQAEDPDHSVFWLTVADQFAKRGIDCRAARERALAMIDDGTDLALMARLGMAEKDLAKRRRMLAELRSRLAAPVAGKPRAVLKAPQPLLMQPGEALAYPMSNGHCINPYFPSKERMQPAWRQDSWGACVVIECGRAFDYLAWYRPIVVELAFREKPALGDLRGPRLWYRERAGTCSRSHYRRMALCPIGSVPLDPDRLAQAFALRKADRPAIDAASDISIANRLKGPTLEADERRRRLRARVPRIEDLAAILEHDPIK
jgi:hypothetical protein